MRSLSFGRRAVLAIFAVVTLAGSSQAEFTENYVHAHFRPDPQTGEWGDPVEFGWGSTNHQLFDGVPPQVFIVPGDDQIPLPPGVEVLLPNIVDREPMKRMHIKYSFERLFDGLDPAWLDLEVNAFKDPLKPEDLRVDIVDRRIIQPDQDNPLPMLFFDVRIYPNPDWEAFFLSDVVNVPGATPQSLGILNGNLVAVDVWTESVPVPEASTVVSWLLMGMTGLGMVWIRRRRAA